jgi:tetratricopeptide (TPR) repeat protein
MKNELKEYMVNFENRLSNLEASSQMYSTIKSLNSSKTQRCNATVAEGVSLYQRGLMSQALKKFDEALLIEIDVDAYNNKGYIHYEESDFLEAIRAFSAAILLLPQFTSLYMNRLKVWVTIMRNFERRGDNEGVELVSKWLKWDADQMIKYGESPNAVADFIESL